MAHVMASDQIEDQPVVVVENVELGYGRIPVLTAVQMEVRQGDFWCFIGPNGEGKTTLIKALLGAVRPRRGRIALRSDFMKRTRIGFVPQESELNPAVSTTVQEFISCGMIGLPVDSSTRRLRLEQSMKLMEIQRFRDRRIWELSGGQRQRALIARALVRDPLMMIVDEPTAGLDFAAAAGLLETITQLNKEKGITVIFVTHDLDIAANHSSHVALFRGGRALTGPTRELLTSDNLSDTFGVSMEVTWLKSGGASIRSRVSPAEHTESLRDTFLQEQIEGAPQEAGLNKPKSFNSETAAEAFAERAGTASGGKSASLGLKTFDSEKSTDAEEAPGASTISRPTLQGIGSLEALLVKTSGDEEIDPDTEKKLDGDDGIVEETQQESMQPASPVKKTTASAPDKKPSIRKSATSRAKVGTRASSKRQVEADTAPSAKNIKKKSPATPSGKATRKTQTKSKSSSSRANSESPSPSKAKPSSAKTPRKTVASSRKKKSG
jgi:zinc transport system ATP-binding protein